MDFVQAINISKGCVMASMMDSETKQAVLEALSQMVISKTETTSCEWCEIASACEYEVTFFRAVGFELGDDRGAITRSLMPNYCPNCGRKLKENENET